MAPTQAAQRRKFDDDDDVGEDEDLLPGAQQPAADIVSVRSELKRLGEKTDSAQAESLKAQGALSEQIRGLEQQMASVAAAVEKLSTKLDGDGGQE